MVITQEQREAVSRAVAEAERGTSGEIVPVLARQSGRYDRAEDICGLVFALAALAFVWLVFQDLQVDDGGWAPRFVPAVGLVGMLVAVVVGFAGGVFVAARFPLLRRPFVPTRQMRADVERAAAEAFFKYRVRRTANATGVVLYVSVYERIVRVVGDDAIATVLTQSDWNEVRDRIIERVRQGEIADGLIAGVESAGRLLRTHFPAADADTDPDELHNELRII